jgi:hypothetical protein
MDSFGFEPDGNFYLYERSADHLRVLAGDRSAGIEYVLRADTWCNISGRIRSGLTSCLSTR